MDLNQNNSLLAVTSSDFNFLRIFQIKYYCACYISILSYCFISVLSSAQLSRSVYDPGLDP